MQRRFNSKNRFLWFLAAAGTIGALQNCSVASDTSIIARVNGTAIDVSEFRDRLLEYRGSTDSGLSQSPDFLALKKRVLSELIEEKVILAETRRRDISVSPSELERAVQDIEQDYPKGGLDNMLAQNRMTRARWRERMRRKILLEKIVAEITKDVPAPSQEKIKEYYETHQENFRREEQMKVQQVVVKTEDDGERVLQELKKGKSLDDLARSHSFTPEGSQGGHLGLIPKGILPPAVDEALAKLNKGQTSAVIETEYGFHVLRLLDRKPATRESLEEATPRIISMLTQVDREQRFSEWRQQNLSNARIERNHALLAKIN